MRRYFLGRSRGPRVGISEGSRMPMIINTKDLNLHYETDHRTDCFAEVFGTCAKRGRAPQHDSDSFQRYLWEANEDSKNLSRLMEFHYPMI